ncbi:MULTISPECIES: hypothetical protein [Mesorhizobium]|nr:MULTISPECIES: hypothetical protein [Mesorhizobium]CAH2408899.1 conserved hypothetical protein [Mesorhizobium escarrei]
MNDNGKADDQLAAMVAAFFASINDLDAPADLLAAFREKVNRAKDRNNGSSRHAPDVE